MKVEHKTVDVFFDYGLSFHLKTDAEGIRAGFFVASEELYIKMLPEDALKWSIEAGITISRHGSNYVATIDKSNSEVGDPDKTGDSENDFKQSATVVKRLLDQTGFAPSKQHLLVSGFFKEFWPISIVAREVQGLRAFQLNPRIAREPSAPSVEGNLGRRGENLAAALDRMRTNENSNFAILRSWLRDVVPTFESIVPDYTETRQMGLFFEEEGAGSRWYSEDVSDGTIMSVALFFALLDTRHRTVVIEEPETSLHPWILKRFLDRCREQSDRCQIIITTHSPLAVAQAKPEELFLISRSQGVTSLVRAVDTETALSEIVREGCLDLGQYWLSGGLGAVPEVPTVKPGELFPPSD